MAWMLLSNASVLSLQDGILTLRFARDGDLKGFSVSGHDAVLKRVLSSSFGLNVTVKGVVGGDPGPGAAGQALARTRVGPARPRRPGPGQPAGGARRRNSPRRIAGPAYRTTSRRTRCRPMRCAPDEPSPATGRPATELTGMDLIQRELGGQVIGEIEG